MASAGPSFAPGFHPAVERWFSQRFAGPTIPQRQGWAAIQRGEHTLIAAPTGSGKTLAAFLWALNDLFRDGVAGALADETRVVYVSPLKALSNDIHKNLEEPLAGITESVTALGGSAPEVRAAVRTGDTPSRERAAMRKRAPHILVTTPESLYLVLTSESGREMLRKVRTVIVDEIHALAPNRRGAHLALTLERLDALVGRPVQRIGLSATQKPIEEVARFLVGTPNLDAQGNPRCTIVDSGHKRDLDIALELPRSPLEAVMSKEVWDEVYDRLAELVRAHRTTLVFVNTRRLAERVSHHLAQRLDPKDVATHHGSLSMELRHAAEQRLKAGELRVLVATASLELGIDIGDVDLVCQLSSPRSISAFLQRVGRSGHWLGGTSKGRLFPLSRDELVECAALLRCVRRGELDRLVIPPSPLDVLAQQLVAATVFEDASEDELLALCRRAYPFRSLTQADFDAVLAMLAEGFATKRGRRAALLHHDAINRRVRARPGARIVALTSGGTIPENADYQVRLEPAGTFIGTLNEDFAIESLAGDVFQLGTSSWRILQVLPGVVRVEDAKGQPPSMPFWLGEAPARSDEISRAISLLRGELEPRLDDPAGAAAWARRELALAEPSAEQLVEYMAATRQALGALPTQEHVIAERFFDETGGMQLVLHSPFGARVNKAWGLALRKRFCRSFNIELQAAATDDAIVISLSTHHSFPLADVFAFLSTRTVRDVLIQAMLDAPVFPVRWRWNAGRALAIARHRGGRRVPPPFQRIEAEELLGAAFPDQVACAENLPGDREIPDHPLVRQTIDDCLHEFMDLDGLLAVLSGIEKGAIACSAVDLPTPSLASHEIINARPYAFLDDAPLEERRTRAVYARRTIDSAGDLGALDPAAIARVVSEVRFEPRSADEAHDALMVSGLLSASEAEGWDEHLRALVAAGRAAALALGERRYWLAAERWPLLRAVYPHAAPEPRLDLPERLQRDWERSDAVRELVRGRMESCGPTTVGELASALQLESSDLTFALYALESEGGVLRGRFRPGAGDEEWCDRRLLARIHRLTINRLRAEIEPVSSADFQRFLLAWQHVEPSERMHGPQGLEAVLAQLDGLELPAGVWESEVLRARVADYSPHWLDQLCLSGAIGWGRLRPASAEARGGPAILRTSPVALFARDKAAHWLALAAGGEPPEPSASARRLLDVLGAQGASFFADLKRGTGLLEAQLEDALAELVAHGRVSSDSFAGLRALLVRGNRRGRDGGDRHRRGRAVERAGRFWLLPRPLAGEPSTEDIEAQARALLRRYGVVVRRVLERVATVAPWRDLLRVYRRLEARGEIRGGHFVTGFGGEHFALPEALSTLRKVRRDEPSGDYVVLSAADPLNLTGVVLPGERVPAIASHRILFKAGLPVAVLEGRRIRPLAGADAALEPAAELALRRRVVRSGVGGVALNVTGSPLSRG